MPLRVGDQVDAYRLVKRLGEGGMGAVFLSIHEGTRQEFALKVLHEEYAQQPDMRERFTREADALRRLAHKGIVGVKELLDRPQGLCIVMEYAEGRTFEQIIDEDGPRAVREALDLILPVLEAVAYAHRLGVVHRDFKPANLMLLIDGTVRVLDFGMARLVDRPAITRVGVTLGTLAYMAPEQVLGETVTQSADVYALGVTLFELLTGRLPFEDQDVRGLIRLVFTQDPPSMASLGAEVPEELEAIVRRCLEKRPEARFGNVVGLRRALLEVRQSIPDPSPPPDPTANTSGVTSAAIVRRRARLMRQSLGFASVGAALMGAGGALSVGLGHAVNGGLLVAGSQVAWALIVWRALRAGPEAAPTTRTVLLPGASPAAAPALAAGPRPGLGPVRPSAPRMVGPTPARPDAKTAVGPSPARPDAKTAIGPTPVRPDAKTAIGPSPVPADGAAGGPTHSSPTRVVATPSARVGPDDATVVRAALDDDPGGVPESEAPTVIRTAYQSSGSRQAYPGTSAGIPVSGSVDRRTRLQTTIWRHRAIDSDAAVAAARELSSEMPAFGPDRATPTGRRPIAMRTVNRPGGPARMARALAAAAAVLALAAPALGQVADIRRELGKVDDLVKVKDFDGARARVEQCETLLAKIRSDEDRALEAKRVGAARAAIDQAETTYWLGEMERHLERARTLAAGGEAEAAVQRELARAREAAAKVPLEGERQRAAQAAAAGVATGGAGSETPAKPGPGPDPAAASAAAARLAALEQAIAAAEARAEALEERSAAAAKGLEKAEADRAALEAAIAASAAEAAELSRQHEAAGERAAAAAARAADVEKALGEAAARHEAVRAAIAESQARQEALLAALEESAARREALAKALGDLEAQAKALEERRAAAEATLQAALSGSEAIEAAGAKLAALAARTEALDGARARLEEAQAAAAAAAGKTAALDAADQRLAASHEALRAAEARLAELTGKAEALSAEHAQRNAALMGELAAGQDALDAARKAAADLADARARTDELAKVSVELERAREALERTAALGERAAAADATLAAIAALGARGKALEAGLAASEALSAKGAELSPGIEQAKARLDEVAALQAEGKRLAKALAQVRDAVSEAAALRKEMEEIRTALSELARLKDDAEALREGVEKARDAVAGGETLAGRLELVEKTLSGMAKTAAELEAAKAREAEAAARRQEETGRAEGDVALAPDGRPLPEILEPLEGEPHAYRSRIDGAVYLWVPGGRFPLGSEVGGDDERPVREVSVAPFFIGRTEVTNAQYEAFLLGLKEGGADKVRAVRHPLEPEAKADLASRVPGVEGATDLAWEGTEAPQGARRAPVVLVDWWDAQAYARWAGGALPSEAQWELAASYGGEGIKRTFPWGERYESNRARLFPDVRPRVKTAEERDAWLETNPLGARPSWRILPPGILPRGATLLGAMDMSGNVAEWCRDAYSAGFYAACAEQDPVNEGEAGSPRAVRGGSWASLPAEARTTARSSLDPGTRSDRVGFRVVIPR